MNGAGGDPRLGVGRSARDEKRSISFRAGAIIEIAYAHNVYRTYIVGSSRRNDVTGGGNSAIIHHRADYGFSRFRIVCRTRGGGEVKRARGTVKVKTTAGRRAGWESKYEIQIIICCWAS